MAISLDPVDMQLQFAKIMQFCNKYQIIQSRQDINYDFPY